MFCVPGVARIANISVTAATISRHANHVSDGDDDVVIQLWQQGLAGLMQGKHESCVKSREALIIDNAMPARICTEGPSRFWALAHSQTENDRVETGSYAFRGSESGRSVGLSIAV